MVECESARESAILHECVCFESRERLDMIIVRADALIGKTLMNF